MSVWDSIRGLFSSGGAESVERERGARGGTLAVSELARRLGTSEAELRALKPSYRTFRIPKRAGGQRTIYEPEANLKKVQRLILRRLLRRLASHAAANGFERHRSVVTNALPHAGKRVVLRMDIKDFFGSTRAAAVEQYFRRVGWDNEAASLLARLCAYDGALPQGAPTSPRLSNLLNVRLDARLSALARKWGADYTRYADDMTFSFAEDDAGRVRLVIRAAKMILKDEGYTLHTRRKLHVRRQHDRQMVAGLVVNRRAQLPRATRRWLRAVEHRVSQGLAPTLTPAQLAGWRAYQKMVAEQQNQSRGLPN